MISLFQQTDGNFTIFSKSTGKAMYRDLLRDEAFEFLTDAVGEREAARKIDLAIRGVLKLDRTPITSMSGQTTPLVA
jgi:hypothetical protein